ncbi:MAG: TonB-dependent receptor, partial [Bacteroidetes bacterium]|nr:TonB-dependent receptor [Bacteroidota bacterium]
LGYRFRPGLKLEWLGMYAENEFRLDPNGRKTFFGTLSQNELLAPSNLQSLWIRFDEGNEEVDAYQTFFSGLRLKSQLSPNVRMEHDVSIYDTHETELLDLSGTAILYQVDPGSGNPDSGEGLFPTGSSRQEDAADNRIEVRTSTLTGRYILTRGRHAVEAGWSLRSLSFGDRLREKTVVVGRATNGDTVRIVADSLNDAASLSTSQQAFHLQDSWDVLADEPGRLTVTSGVRVDRFDFTGEWTVSPRASFTWKANPITTWFGSVGRYHQAPTYRELRGKPEIGESILGALNTSLRSQRSLQVVIGGEYFIPSRRFFFRTEAWLKNIDHLISYDIENVRVLYSGENDAKGQAYGLDLQLRGELVPGMESWLNYSYLVAREEFSSAFQTPNNRGRVARPTDQRHTVSLFVQDYIPSDPTWRLHLRTLYGSG